MDDPGRSEDRAEEESADSPVEEINEDEERCVETGRNLINSLLEDSEAQTLGSSSNSDEFEPAVKMENEENSLDSRILLQPASIEILSQCSSPLEPFIEIDVEEEVYDYVPEGVNAADLLEEVPEESGPSTSYEEDDVVILDETAHIAEELLEGAGPLTSYEYIVVEEKPEILEEFPEELGGPSTSYEDCVAQERTQKLLTDLWIRENCVASSYSSMPREEIYAVYLDDMRNRCESVGYSREMFWICMSEIFPSVRFRKLRANGIRLSMPHRLAPSSLDWNMTPIMISNIDLLKGEAEGSPIERVTMLWVAQNCVVDSEATTPMQELYATYISELRKKNRAFNGSIFLFESVLKKLFPEVQIRKTQLMVFIKGVKFVGPRKTRQINDNRYVNRINTVAANSPVEASTSRVSTPPVLMEIEKVERDVRSLISNDEGPPVLLETARTDPGVYGETSNDEAPPILVQAGSKEDNSGDFGDVIMDGCDQEASFSGTVRGQRNDLAEIPESSSRCSICYQIFINPFGLKVHMRKHSRGMPTSKQSMQTMYLNADKANLLLAMDEQPLFADVKTKELMDFAENGQETYTKEEPIDFDHDNSPPVIASVKEPPSYPYKCPVCCKGFRDPFKYAIHVRQYKDGVIGEDHDLGPNIFIDTDPRNKKKHRCGICNKAFAIFRDLTVHYRTHTGEKPFGCTICDKKFSDKRRLKAHERIHTGEKRFQCDQCDKAFNWAADLKLHYRNHSGEKPYVCDQCPKAFGTSGHLSRHKRIHTGEKKYSCEHCEKTFIQGYDLRNHMRKHTGEKYECEHCDKRFVHKVSWKAHLMKHTGEKPFACKECDKSFPLKSYLRSHVLRQHASEVQADESEDQPEEEEEES